MNDVMPAGAESDYPTAEIGPYQGQNGTHMSGYSGNGEGTHQAAGDLDPVLAGAQDAITALTSQVNRAYAELAQRGEQLRRREELAREHEQKAEQTLAEAQQQAEQTLTGARQEAEQTLTGARREAEQTLTEARQEAEQTLTDARQQAAQLEEQARQQEADTMRRAEAEATRIVERARSIEGQIAERLAETARRDQELQEREQRLADTAQRQQAERDWLNEYAQRLTSIASDLERALGDSGDSAG